MWPKRLSPLFLKYRHLLFKSKDKKIYVGSIWTKYGLVILGVAGEIMLGGDFNARGGLRCGYHPKARVSLSLDGR